MGEGLELILLPQEEGLKAPRSAECRGKRVTQLLPAQQALCRGTCPAGAHLCLAEPPAAFGASFHRGWCAAGAWSRRPRLSTRVGCCRGRAAPLGALIRAGSCTAVPGLAAASKAN